MKKTCAKCGKKARRECPALGKICSQCCGSQRNNSIDCTESCPFNPFNPELYSSFVEIEDLVTLKLMEFYEDHFEEDMTTRTVESYLETTTEEAVVHAMAHATLGLTCALKDADGKTGLEAFADAGFPGMTNDETQLAKCWGKARPAVVEVKQGIDDIRTECINLLDPERGAFIIQDRILAYRRTEVPQFFSWVIDLPYYSRGGGILTEVTDQTGAKLVEHLKEISSIEQAGPQLVRYVAANFADVLQIVRNPKSYAK